MNIGRLCERIYVNVLSISVDDNDAYICCNELNSDSNLSLWNVLFSDYEKGLCSRRVSDYISERFLEYMNHEFHFGTKKNLYR